MIARIAVLVDLLVVIIPVVVLGLVLVLVFGVTSRFLSLYLSRSWKV